MVTCQQRHECPTSFCLCAAHSRLDRAESASFWLSVLTDLKARGVNDILIACTDNLNGFNRAIAEVYPKTVTQLCVVHQIRNSLKYVGWKERKAFVADLKDVYPPG